MTTTTQTTTTLADAVTNAYLAGNADALADLCIDDVLVEVVVPQWRFQIAGRESAREGLAHEEFVPGREVVWHQRTAIEDGLLLEVESVAPMHGEPHRWLEMNRFRFADGRIVEIVQYCSGFMDAATQARNAAEAPLVRHR
jgi:hypothetical protein